MKKIKSFAAIALCVAAASCSKRGELTADYNVVPLPQSVELSDGEGYKLTSATSIVYTDGDSALLNDAELLAGYLKQMTGLKISVAPGNPGAGVIALQSSLDNDNPEAYNLTVTNEGITINGATAAGTFYGVQTLRKSIPAAGKNNVTFPAVVIADQPRFAYRGAHFDVSRHFFPADSVKSFIDMLALHNINKLHWHITDDQGWRIEIKSHPELIEKGSKRGGTVIGHNTGVYDSIPYGGFFTQDEARDIVKYAADRHITVIPEIDLPGHMLGALTAYPELGCTGGPYDVWQQWGVSEDVLCAGNDATYKFIEDVLSEIVEIFPSEYIHVGGDECPKVRWKDCPKCQAKIKALGLKSDARGTAEEKLQSHVIHHASNFLASKGRKIIGWDEILEGGLAPGAIVMSWRGENGGIEAAKKGHDVIMTPNNYLYFDYYQTLDRENEPEAIGGYVPVQRVYGYEPIPQALTSDEGKHIIGVQANLWTEYIPTFSQAQYMELPRMAALADVQWSAAPKDYKAFSKRVRNLLKHYDANGYNYAKHMFDVEGTITPDIENGIITLTLQTIDDAPIHYTLDGSEPTADSPVYTEPVVLRQSADIRAVAIRSDGNSKEYTNSVSFNKATAHPVTLVTKPHRSYAGQGGVTLVDGKFGNSGYNSGDWLGYAGNNLVADINLESEQEISSLALRTNIDTNSWIFDAREINLAVSGDGKTFTQVASAKYPAMTADKTEIARHELKFSTVKAQYVRVTVKPESKIPAWHGGAGHSGFVFVDEIELN